MKATDDTADAASGLPAPSGARRPGRPRSDQAEEAILDAVFSLFSDGATYDGLSMEMIAAAAKVGKATIYRRWPNKEALVISAICRRLDPQKEIRVPGGSVRDDLIHLLELMRRHLQHTSTGPAYNVLNQVSVGNPNLYRRYHEVVIEPRRDLYRQVLRRGVATGELREDLDVERAMLMLTSTMLAVTRHNPTPEAVGTEFSVALVDDLLRGAAKRPAEQGGAAATPEASSARRSGVVAAQPSRSGGLAPA